MEIRGEDYQVAFDPDTGVITCEGSLRLRGAEGYADIVRLFNHVADRKPETITLQVEGLKFLNSSGINALSKFIIRVRDENASKLAIRGALRFSWQSKSLVNLQRLMPTLTLELV